jgi:hypothetical protein
MFSTTAEDSGRRDPAHAVSAAKRLADFLRSALRGSQPIQGAVTMMRTNEAGWDRGIRVVLGVALISLALGGVWWPWGLIGAVPLLTGLTGNCPLYGLFGVSTCKAKHA